MGRGDKKTKKGKIFMGSFGKSRPVTKSKKTTAEKTTAEKTTAEKTTAEKATGKDPDNKES